MTTPLNCYHDVIWSIEDTGCDLRQRGQQSTFGLLLTDTPMAQGDVQKETGTNAMILNDGDDILCVQPTPNSIDYAAVAHQQPSAGMVVEKNNIPLAQGRNMRSSVQPLSIHPVRPAQLKLMLHVMDHVGVEPGSLIRESNGQTTGP